MRRLFLLLLLILLSVHSIDGQDVNSFINKRVYNLGMIKDKNKCTVDFYYSNDSGHELTVQAVYTSCGCISVDYPKQKIKEKEKGSIKVSVDITSVRGYFEKKILLYVSSLKPIILKIRGFVIQ